MIPVRRNIEIREGVTAEMLFTPHLYSYKGEKGITFEADDNSPGRVFEYYADLFYCAALNAWELDGRGDREDFPFTRGDFHALITSSPKEFARAMEFALRALTGKTLAELTAKVAEEGEAKPEEGKKKASSSWIGRAWRRSSSAVAARRNAKRD